MQPLHTHLDQVTQTILQEEWDRIKNTEPVTIDKKSGRSTPANDPSENPGELSAVVTVLPGLIRLVSECTDRPVSKFRPTVTRLIREQQFIDTAGDSIVDPHLNVRIEWYVELTVCVLQRVREVGHEPGVRRDTPVTPQMFG
jgi:hypothetical protein